MPLPSMSEVEIQAFARGVCGGKIAVVVDPLRVGLSWTGVWTTEELAEAGAVWQLDELVDWRVTEDGLPVFASGHLISREDWEKALVEMEKSESCARGVDT